MTAAAFRRRNLPSIAFGRVSAIRADGYVGAF